MRQNITIALEKELLQKARVLAANRGTSISRMLADEIERLVGEADAYELARRAALAELERGLHLGGEPAPRASLYER